jgi:hypothetical protein
MNSIIWHTIGDFVCYLGDSGKCRIVEDDKGWHIQLIGKEEELRKKILSSKPSESGPMRIELRRCCNDKSNGKYLNFDIY